MIGINIYIYNDYDIVIMKQLQLHTVSRLVRECSMRRLHRQNESKTRGGKTKSRLICKKHEYSHREMIGLPHRCSAGKREGEAGMGLRCTKRPGYPN